LIDRLWPRGLTKEAAAIYGWLKELAPIDELRKWYDHQPEKYPGFRKKYFKELSSPEKQAFLKQLADYSESSDITIVYSAKDTRYNNAVVLEELVNKIINL